MEEMHPVVLEIANAIDQCNVKKANRLLDVYAQEAVVKSCEPLWKQLAAAERRVEKMRKGLMRADRLLIEHHAIGAMDGLTRGGSCPVCVKKDPTIFTDISPLLARDLRG